MRQHEIKQILVPVDFSEISANSLETAVAMSKRHLTTLTLIHIVENMFPLLSADPGGAPKMILPDLVKAANERLNELAKALRTQHDIVVKQVVQTGNPADEICRWAHLKATDLIVMGTHGASGLREFFMGSNAYRVVKNSPCPVMTIPGTNTWIDFKKILFPIRMVPNALDKYHVVRPIIRRNGSSLLIAGIVKKSEPESVIKMREFVDSVKVKIEEDEVICRSEIRPAEDVAKEVLKISELEKPDLIVITATLDSSLKDFFLGPYTQDIVNHARFPVLSIRAQVAEESTEDEAQWQGHG
jgi:nucleotide-binding universal stress UspA family protein